MNDQDRTLAIALAEEIKRGPGPCTLIGNIDAMQMHLQRLGPAVSLLLVSEQPNITAAVLGQIEHIFQLPTAARWNLQRITPGSFAQTTWIIP